MNSAHLQRSVASNGWGVLSRGAETPNEALGVGGSFYSSEGLPA